MVELERIDTTAPENGKPVVAVQPCKPWEQRILDRENFLRHERGDGVRCLDILARIDRNFCIRFGTGMVASHIPGRNSDGIFILLCIGLRAQSFDIQAETILGNAIGVIAFPIQND